MRYTEEIEKEKGSKQREQPRVQEEEQNKALTKQENQTAIHVSTKSQSEIEEESPSFGSSTSTLTDDSDTTKHEKPVVNVKEAVRSLLSKKRSKCSAAMKEKKKGSDGDGDGDGAGAGVEGACKNPTAEDQCTKGKNNSSSASKMLKNLISCGDVETKDSTVSAAMRKPFMSMCSSELDQVSSAALCRMDAFGGSQRVFGNPPWAQQQFGTRYVFQFSLFPTSF